MYSKEHKSRPSKLSRSISHAFGGSRHNASQHAPATQWSTMPPVGLPVVDHNPWPARAHKRHLTWSDELPKPSRRSPSLRSITATASAISEETPSLVADEYSTHSAGTSSLYSGFNSAYPAPTFGPYLPSTQILALLDSSCSTLVWDIRTEPKMLSASHFCGPNELDFPLTLAASGQLHIISPDFPWTIELGPMKGAITGKHAIHALYEFFNKELEDAVWALANDSERSSIERAWKRRSDTDTRIRNVDWLGSRFMLKGFYRDSEFVEREIRPDNINAPETLLVIFKKT